MYWICLKGALIYIMWKGSSKPNNTQISRTHFLIASLILFDCRKEEFVWKNFTQIQLKYSGFLIDATERFRKNLLAVHKHNIIF